MAVIHKKVWREYFEKITSGKKRFEIRLSDFEVKEGDTLVLEEWNENKEELTGRKIETTVTYVIKTKDLPFWAPEEVDKYSYQVIQFEPKKKEGEIPPRVYTQTFGVVGALLERDGKILLVREASRKGQDAGKWNHPAGWVEVGENPLHAISREVLEESGYSFTPKNILGIYSLVRLDIKKEMNAVLHPIKIIYTGDISDKQNGKLENDVTEVKWFTPNEIYAMGRNTLRDADIKQMVKDYFSGKKFPLDLLTHSIANN